MTHTPTAQTPAATAEEQLLEEAEEEYEYPETTKEFRKNVDSGKYSQSAILPSGAPKC